MLVRQAHLLDPRAGLDGPGDLLIRDGQIAALGEPGALEAPEGCEVVEAQGLHAFPGFVDPHVHLRTPGQEYKEDIDTGTRAAAAGGFCAILAMPNTRPVVDNASIVQSLREVADEPGPHPHRLHRRGHRGPERRAADRGGRPGRRGRRRADRRRAADPLGRHHAPGAAVPAAGRPDDRAARGGPDAVGRRRHARGRGVRAAGRGRHPVGQRVRHGGPRLRPGRLRGRAHPHTARVRPGHRGDHRAGQGRRRQGHGRGHAAPPAAHSTRRCARWTPARR